MNAPDTASWFYVQQNQQFGPVSFDELRTKALARNLDPLNDLAWTEGMTEWIPTGKVDGLFKPRATPPPLPAPVPTVAAPAPLASSPAGETAGEPQSGIGQVVETLAKIALPAFVLAGAGCWLGFWVVDAIISSFLPEGGVRVPWILLILFYGGIGYGGGKILGFVMQLAGIGRFHAAKLIGAALIISAAILGELSFVTLAAALNEEPFTLGNIIGLLLNPFAGDDMAGFFGTLMHYLLRALMVLGAIMGAKSLIAPDYTNNSPLAGLPAQ